MGMDFRPHFSFKAKVFQKRFPMKEKLAKRKRKANNNRNIDNVSAGDLNYSGLLTPPNEAKDTTHQSPLLVNVPFQKKWKNAAVRTLWTVVMISGFIGILYSGHPAVILLVVFIQTMVYREVISIAHVPYSEKKLPFSKKMTWYFLFATNYFLYGETMIHYFNKSFLVDALLLPLASHHRFTSFTLYVLGLVFFVMHLKKGYYKFQFSQFAWTHMALLLVVVQSHFIINNIFEGMIWFVLPVSLVICNDIFAYICGFFWGKTPLIKLSPKKTWEGFIGALICTLVFGFFFTGALTKYPYMICSFRELTKNGGTCIPESAFVPSSYKLIPPLVSLRRHLFQVDNRYIEIAPIQVHALLMTCFASLIAPFGGFFASGVKRAFNIKDFGDSIPGHGGITDRMDCQFLMGLFSYMYLTTFIKRPAVSTVESILHMAISTLSETQQLELFHYLKEYLQGQGLIDV